MRHILFLSAALLPTLLLAKDPTPPPAAPAPVVREVQYDGTLNDKEARFTVLLNLESLARGESSLPLFEGDLALLPPAKLPDNLRLVRVANQYHLVISKPGQIKLKLELIAKITRTELWNQISFLGPEAAIGSLTAQASGGGVELQMLNGTVTEPQAKGGPARVKGLLGADRTVALRWQSQTTESARKALVTSETSCLVQISPAVLKFTTTFHYDIVQGAVSKLTLTLPASQALTRLQGEQIRDWQIKPEGDHQLLSIELVKPLEKQYSLTLQSEQPVESAQPVAPLSPPQPLDLARETGTLTLTAEDVLVETDAMTGVRQINAVGNELARYQFFGRPVQLSLKLRRIEPVVTAATRVTARLEESRLLATHNVTLTVEKAGIYTVELAPLGNFLVADVRGPGIEDWKAAAGKLVINFTGRLLGTHSIDISLEQAQKNVPNQITLLPLRVTGAVKESTVIGADTSAGFRLKTAKLTGLREVPVTVFAPASVALAYTADQPDWQLAMAVEKLSPRTLVDIFNLVTIGDGIVGGSATVRYAILNQGVQEFRLRLPAHWKNVEFTGPNIRRKDLQKDPQGDLWTLGLQEKAWGSYTLVITYDANFDPQRASLAIGGIHALDVERETGTVAITSAANLQLTPKLLSGPLQRVDESELAAADRALISRTVRYAYRYPSGDPYELNMEVTRYDAERVLDAVIDRTQLTTVLTDAGQMLTQASFMVKNNDKQYQRFTLPVGSEFWSCFVDNQPVKAESDGNSLLVPLPRGQDRDRAFAVDIVYVQKMSEKAGEKQSANSVAGGTGLKSWKWQPIALEAPKTDVQTTFAEWELYVPTTHTLVNFGGNMTVARGTTYGWHDAWHSFTEFYGNLLSAGEGIAFTLFLLAITASLVIAFVRRGKSGVWAMLVTYTIMFLFLGLLMPSLRCVKERANRTFDNAQSSMDVAESPSNTYALGVAPNQPAATAATGSGHVGNGFQTAHPTAGGEIITQHVPISLAEPVTTPVAAGIRPIRIDIPRTGTRFVFTKVLNVRNVHGLTGADVHGEPLSATAWAVKSKVNNLIRGTLQAFTILIGLMFFWRQWHRTRPGGFWMTVGLALIFAGVGSLLITIRLLDVVLMLLPPVLVLAVMIRLARKYIPQRQPPVPTPPPTAGGTPVVVQAAAILLLSCAAAQAADPGPARPLSFPHSISAASYTGTVHEKVAQFEALFELSTSEPGERIRLFGDDVAVQDFSTTAKELKLIREGNSLIALVAKPGTTSLRLKFVAKITGDVTSRQFGFAIPHALTSRLSVKLDEPDAAVEMPTAISFKTATEQQFTRVEAVLGLANRVELSWTPRMKRAAEMAATVFCQNVAQASFGSGVLSIRSTLSFQVAQGELRQARVQLPTGHRLLRVEGALIRTWDLQEIGGQQILSVDLLKGISSTNWPLTVITEKMLTKLPTQERVELPHALETKRETGWIGLTTSDELSATVETARELQRIEIEEFQKLDNRRGTPADESTKSKPAAARETGPAVFAAYRFQNPQFELTVRVEPVQPQIEGVVQTQIIVGAEQIGLVTQVNYTIKRAGIFALRLALPADYRIESVTGEKISQWVERTEGGSRLLEVALKDRTLGAYSLRVQLVRPHRELPKTIVIPAINPLATQKLSGTVSVSSEAGLQLKADLVEGLTEIPAATVTNHASAVGATLAYKFIASDPAAPAPWRLGVATETVDSWVRAELVSAVTLTETLVSGRTLIRYEIQNAPVKELRLRLPAAFKNVELTGANIRRRDQENGEWRVELQNKIRGLYTLAVTWELPWKDSQGPLELGGIEAVGVERENGALAIAARPPLQVTGEPAAGDLLQADVSELPDWAGRAPESTVLTYRYLRPGWRLKLTANHFKDAGVLQALVDSAKLTTEVAEDGQTMTTVALTVRNNGLPNLRITLPAGAELWTAFVGGQPVRPSKSQGALLLPLENVGGSDAPVAVEFTYVSVEKFPADRGRFELKSPAVNVPLKNARWELCLPPDFSYSQFEGSMAHEEGGWLQTFSLKDYQRVEVEQQQAREAEVTSFLSAARSSLSLNDTKVAASAYNRARYGGKFSGKAKEDFKQVESDLRRVQAGNVMNNANMELKDWDKSANLPAPVQQAAQQGRMQDEEAATKQYDKLQQAQDLAVAHVQPLHVHLPTHGLHHVFTQPLQTELNTPMTVRFETANNRATSWPTLIGLAVGGFAFLWWLTANRLARRKQ